MASSMQKGKSSLVSTVMRLEDMSTEVEGCGASAFLNHIIDRKDHKTNDVEEDDQQHERYMREFLVRMPSNYNHATYQLAAKIFEEVCADATKFPGTPQDVEFDDEQDKRLTYTLVFQTLKYKKFLDDMLEDCRFFWRYPEFREDYNQVLIILCDFKERKFQPRISDAGKKQSKIPVLSDIEDALLACKTKLNAALARSRIKARVLATDHLLPASVRQNDKIGSNMHMYCWVNHIKTNMKEVTDLLVDIGFARVDSEANLARKTYYLDYHCPDAITFAYEEREFLEAHVLITDSQLIVQDKSSCVGVHSVRALMNEGDDILFVNADGGISIGHLASLTHLTDSVIFCFGVKSKKQYETIIQNLDRIGVNTRVQLFMEDFRDVHPLDERLKHIKIVLLVASCSRSGVANPVNFIVSEGEDLSILKDLSLGYTDENKLNEMIIKHNSLLRHVLQFPLVQAVVYCTRSLLDRENESVVTRCIECTNATLQTKTPFRISPPVLTLSTADIESGVPLNGKYLKYLPSSFMSGCFVTTITREADDPREAARAILARAEAKGIFNVNSPVIQKGKKNKKKKVKEVVS